MNFDRHGHGYGKEFNDAQSAVVWKYPVGTIVVVARCPPLNGFHDTYGRFMHLPVRITDQCFGRGIPAPWYTAETLCDIGFENVFDEASLEPTDRFGAREYVDADARRRAEGRGE